MTSYDVQYVFGKKLGPSNNGYEKLVYGIKWEGYSLDEVTFEQQKNFASNGAIIDYEILQEFQTMDKLSKSQIFSTILLVNQNESKGEIIEFLNQSQDDSRFLDDTLEEQIMLQSKQNKRVSKKFK